MRIFLNVEISTGGARIRNLPPPSGTPLLTTTIPPLRGQFRDVRGGRCCGCYRRVLAGATGPRAPRVQSLRRPMPVFRSCCDVLYGERERRAGQTPAARRPYAAVVASSRARGGTWPGLSADVLALPFVFAVPNRRFHGARDHRPPRRRRPVVRRAVRPRGAQDVRPAAVRRTRRCSRAARRRSRSTRARSRRSAPTPVLPSPVFVSNSNVFTSDAPGPATPNVVSAGSINLRPPKRIPNVIILLLLFIITSILYEYYVTFRSRTTESEKIVRT